MSLIADRSFHIHDASLCVKASSNRKSKNGWRDAPDWETYNRIKDLLVANGFVISKDPRIEKEYPILSPTHDCGRYGDLQFVCETYPAGCKFEFFQDVNYENRNGGRYDFDRVAKMPYLVRLRWQLTITKIKTQLICRGFTERTKKINAVDDPLAHFNQTWDMGEMARGTLRFHRGDDGWPSDKELSSWGRKDRYGERIEHGDYRYFRNRKGYLMRGRAYGGINSMWMVIYGKGKNDVTHLSAGELFKCNPSKVPRKIHPNSLGAVENKLREAIEQEQFERAVQLRDARDRLAA